MQSYGLTTIPESIEATGGAGTPDGVTPVARAREAVSPLQNVLGFKGLPPADLYWPLLC